MMKVLLFVVVAFASVLTAAQQDNPNITYVECDDAVCQRGCRVRTIPTLQCIPDWPNTSMVLGCQESFSMCVSVIQYETADCTGEAIGQHLQPCDGSCFHPGDPHDDIKYAYLSNCSHTADADYVSLNYNCSEGCKTCDSRLNIASGTCFQAPFNGLYYKFMGMKQCGRVMAMRRFASQDCTGRIVQTGSQVLGQCDGESTFGRTHSSIVLCTTQESGK